MVMLMHATVWSYISVDATQTELFRVETTFDT